MKLFFSSHRKFIILKKLNNLFWTDSSLLDTLLNLLLEKIILGFFIHPLSNLFLIGINENFFFNLFFLVKSSDIAFNFINFGDTFYFLILLLFFIVIALIPSILFILISIN